MNARRIVISHSMLGLHAKLHIEQATQAMLDARAVYSKKKFSADADRMALLYERYQALAGGARE